ncbi:hypothetical protein N7445_003103 [Penicillium cf. griseofulvum]|nr:hypothetical protein N7445_003103 [Penicillium cf. griseofulvum]
MVKSVRLSQWSIDHLILLSTVDRTSENWCRHLHSSIVSQILISVNAGTLAYFENQDITKSQKRDMIHDKEVAVKYIVFDDDQWVCFDNNETFKQKVDWADSVGLGGVMIWSIDQDDNDFSALASLLGRSPGDFDSITKRFEVTDTGDWASMNGQKCVEPDCAMNPACATGYRLPPCSNSKSFQDGRSGSKSRVICCLVDVMSESCAWRDGESSRSCHGQYHAGEVTLFHSVTRLQTATGPAFRLPVIQLEHT